MTIISEVHCTTKMQGNSSTYINPRSLLILKHLESNLDIMQTNSEKYGVFPTKDPLHLVKPRQSNFFFFKWQMADGILGQPCVHP